MSAQCKDCKFAVVAEDTLEGKPVAYFCKLDKYEYEVCDVGMVSPDYSCDEGESKWNTLV